MSGSKNPENPRLFREWGNFNDRRARIGRAPIAYDRWYDYTYGEKSAEGEWKYRREKDQAWLIREESNFAEKDKHREAYIAHVSERIRLKNVPMTYDQFITKRFEKSLLELENNQITSEKSQSDQQSHLDNGNPEAENLGGCP